VTTSWSFVPTRTVSVPGAQSRRPLSQEPWLTDPVNASDPTGHTNLSEIWASFNNFAAQTAIRFPKYTGIISFILDALTPMEVHLAYPTGIAWFGGAAGGFALKEVAEGGRHQLRVSLVASTGAASPEAVPVLILLRHPALMLRLARLHSCHS
jgi:hypothetical protein